MSRVGRLSLAATCAAVLTGCAGLPATSGVVVGKPVSAGATSQPLTVLPDGPLPGDDARQIAVGFLQAQMVEQGDRALARSFLTSGASRGWRPGSAATIFGSSADITTTHPDLNTVRMRIPVVATLSSDGHLTRLSSPQYRTLDFSVARQAAGWRISQLPPDLGLWLGQDDFTRLYRAADVYYPSVRGHVMVPDPRWVPQQGTATALARAALTPPPQWLRGAVRSPFPAGTTLGVDAVPVSGSGRAVIDLSASAQRASSADRAAIWATLLATVGQASDVENLTVSSHGAMLETENMPATVRTVGDVGYRMPPSASSLIVRSGSYLAWAAPDAVTAVAGATPAVAKGRPALPPVAPSWTGLAAGPGGRQIAAVSADRASLRRWLNGTAVTVSTLGTELVRPAFDPFGFLWCAGRTRTQARRAGAAAVWALDTSTESAQPPAALTTPWSAAARVVALSIAPDGARAAAVLEEGRSRRLVVTAVLRDSSGRPTGLGAPVAVPNGGEAVDVAWAGATDLAVLTGDGGSRTPAIISLDGDRRSLTAVAGARAIAAVGGDESDVMVTTQAGVVVRQAGSGWASFLTGGSVVVPVS